jgi:acid phosphatase (class A)
MKTQILILILSLFTSSAFADWTKIPSSEFSLPPPPKEGSEDYERDFRILHEEQKTRTEAQCSLARKQKWPGYAVFFKNTEGILTQEEFERAEALGKKVLKFAERVSVSIKKKYNRPRPYDTDNTITPCVDKPQGSKAYPSSHATEAAAGACMLAEIYPDRAGALIEFAKDLGLLRVISGVHHPSDVEAGWDLADAICDRLMQEADFKKEIGRLKAMTPVYDIAN